MIAQCGGRGKWLGQSAAELGDGDAIRAAEPHEPRGAVHGDGKLLPLPRSEVLFPIPYTTTAEA